MVRHESVGYKPVVVVAASTEHTGPFQIAKRLQVGQGPRFYAAFSSGRTTPRLEYLAIDNEIDGEPKMPY